MLIELLFVSFLGAAQASAPPPVIRTPPPVIIPGRSGESNSWLAPGRALERRWLLKLSAEEAIAKAAARRDGVNAVFEVTVRRGAQVGPNYFLGTEDDYRDPRNLAFKVTPRAQTQLRKRYGKDLARAFIGEKLLIGGKAKRVRIALLDSAGRRTGRYYYQTHVEVADPRQIERAPD